MLPNIQLTPTRHCDDALYGSVALLTASADLLRMAPLQWLRGIYQGSAIILADPAINHTRFDHFLGVMLLIRHLGAAYVNY